MKRRLAILRRTKLDDIEGWDGCYFQWTPATYAESQALSQSSTDKMSDHDAYMQIEDMVRDHFAGGKVNIIGEDFKPTLVDMTLEDVAALPPELIQRIFMEMTGAQYVDPKDSSAKSTENSSSPTPKDSPEPQNYESTTETPSSATSSEASPEKSGNQ